MVNLLQHSFVAAPAQSPRRWLLVLHGIYGSGRNWGSIARRLVEARPEWGAILVDLRLHGGSQGFLPPHTVAACAEDLQQLARNLPLEIVGVMGHSFGGKVALAYAQTLPVDLAQVWIIDSTPAVRPPGGDAWQLLQVIKQLPDTFPSRQTAALAIKSAGYSTALADWMVTNLYATAHGWQWKLDFAGIEALLRDFFNTDLWPVVEQPPDGLQFQFVKASASDVLSEEAVQRLVAAGDANRQIFLHELAGGHWLNVENPTALVQLLADKLLN